LKFKYYNDTNRIVNIHPATFAHGCTGNQEPIRPLEERTFILPKGTYPWVKMWDNGENGLSILISPISEENEIKIVANNDFWNQVLILISEKVSSDAYAAWFQHTEAMITDNTITVYCKNIFQRDWIRSQYQDLISTAAKEVTGKDLNLTVITEND